MQRKEMKSRILRNLMVKKWKEIEQAAEVGSWWGVSLIFLYHWFGLQIFKKLVI